MPITHHYDGATRTLHAVIQGTITDEEVLEYARRVAPDTEIPPGRRELIDLSGVEQTDVSGAGLREVADVFRAHDQTLFETKIAIVAPTDIAYGLARMYQAFRSDSPVLLQVFREREAAVYWLGLEG